MTLTFKTPQNPPGEMDDPKLSESWSLRTVRSSAFRVPCLRNESPWFLRSIRDSMAVGVSLGFWHEGQEKAEFPIDFRFDFLFQASGYEEKLFQA